MVRELDMKCICLGSAQDILGPFLANLLLLGMSNNNEKKPLVGKKGLTNKKVI